MTTFDELQTPVTADEGRKLLRGLVTTAPYPIPLVALDTPGAPEGAIIWALGEAEGLRSADRVLFARSATRSTATRPFLGVIAAEVYSLPPRGRDFATTDVTFSNASGSYYGPYAAGALRFKNSASKKLFTNTGPVDTIPGGETVTISVRALESGSASSSLPGEIDALETPLAGVTVTNPAPAIGQDEENSATLNGRIDAKIGSLGTPGARGWNTGATGTSFEAVAKNGPDDGGGCIRADGSRITVTRTRVVTNYTTGVTTLYVADDDGPLNVDDLPFVESDVQTYAEWTSSEVLVENAELVEIVVSGVLTIKNAAATNDAILGQIDVELTNASRASSLGETITLDYVKNAVQNAGDESKATRFKLVSFAPSSPTTDTTQTVGQVAVLVRGTITIVRS